MCIEWEDVWTDRFVDESKVLTPYDFPLSRSIDPVNANCKFLKAGTTAMAISCTCGYSMCTVQLYILRTIVRRCWRITLLFSYCWRMIYVKSCNYKNILETIVTQEKWEKKENVIYLGINSNPLTYSTYFLVAPAKCRCVDYIEKMKDRLFVNTWKIRVMMMMIVLLKQANRKAM